METIVVERREESDVQETIVSEVQRRASHSDEASFTRDQNDKKHFLPNVTEAGLSGIQNSAESPATIFGVGCAHSNGPSAGVPIEWLGMFFRAVKFNQKMGIERAPAVLICQELAFANENMESHREAIEQAGSWHLSIANKLKEEGVQIEIFHDADIVNAAGYQSYSQRYPQTTGHQYAHEQALRFGYLAEQLGYIYKGGWAVKDEVEGEIAAQGGIDEFAFDNLALNTFGRKLFGGYYGPAAFDFTGRAVCPYTAKPGSGRILLHSEFADRDVLHEHIDRLLKSDARGQKLEAKIAAFKSLLGLSELAAEIIPDLKMVLNKIEIESAHEGVLNIQRQIAELRETNGREAKQRVEALNTLERMGRVGICELQREFVVEVIFELISRYGV